MSLKFDPADDYLSILRTERRDLIDRLRQTRFSTLKPGYSHSQLIPFATYSPWLDDEQFMRLHARIQGHTLVDVYRCYDLYLCASQAVSLAGDFVEVGVWRGGTAALISAILTDKQAHLFDTFAGVAKADASVDPAYEGGEHADTKPDFVRELFASLDLKPHLHIGIFPDDTLDALPEQVALAHIDVDVYASARESFAAIWPRISPGGFVIFDDYGFFACEGVTTAVNELRQDLRDGVFVHNLNGHGMFIKR